MISHLLVLLDEQPESAGSDDRAEWMSSDEFAVMLDAVGDLHVLDVREDGVTL